MLPAMKMTEPYSPIPRANASVNPVVTAGMSGGNTIRRRMFVREAPSNAPASSVSRSKSCSTGCTVRTTNGRPTKTSATRMPSGVKATLMPVAASAEPSQPFSA